VCEFEAALAEGVVIEAGAEGGDDEGEEAGADGDRAEGDVADPVGGRADDDEGGRERESDAPTGQRRAQPSGHGATERREGAVDDEPPDDETVLHLPEWRPASVNRL
jgi:hypothetical protein